MPTAIDAVETNYTVLHCVSQTQSEVVHISIAATCVSKTHAV